MLPSIKLF